MEKLNIAELLKDCPRGMELDCTICNNVVTLYSVDKEGYYPINVVSKDGFHYELTCKGYVYDEGDAKCVIFPKGKTTWEGFQRPFKDGDILATDLGSVFFLNMHHNTDEYYGCYVGIGGDSSFHICVPFAYKECCGLATEKEKQKLFDAIKANGYKWNEETKSLEKLIESNEDVDDKIVMSGIYFDREYYADEVELHLNNYEIEIRDGKTYAIFKNQKNETLKPKFKVGDRVVEKDGISVPVLITGVGYEYYYTNTENSVGIFSIKEQDNWELVPNKFDITILNHFDKVLVRDNDTQEWSISLFSHYNGLKNYKYSCINGNGYAQCIPYEGNEHLLGTTIDCDEYFKNWK